MISFRPLAEADLDVLAAWLRSGHVQEWWRHPGAPDAVAAKYLPRIHGTSPTEVLVIVHDGRDVGIIQRYRVADHPAHERSLEPTALDLRAAASLDYLIGDPELVGQGIGSAAIAALTEEVFADWPDIDLVAVTPQAGNVASCRALEKAGYRRVWTGRLDSDDPSDAGDTALYLRRRSDT